MYIYIYNFCSQSPDDISLRSGMALAAAMSVAYLWASAFKGSPLPFKQEVEGVMMAKIMQVLLLLNQLEVAQAASLL